MYLVCNSYVVKSSVCFPISVHIVIMPHSELDRTSKVPGQRGSPPPPLQVTGGLASLNSMHDSDFEELERENVPIAMRGPSSITHIARDWDGFTRKKAARYDSESLTSILGDSSKHDNRHSSYYPNDHRHELSLQDANRAKWLAESHEANLNAPLLSEYFDATTVNINNCSHDHKEELVGILNLKRWKTLKSSPGAEPQLIKRTSSELCQSSLKPCKASVPLVRSQGLDSICISDTNTAHLPTPLDPIIGGSHGLGMQKLQDPGTDKKINFSHFLRPISLVEASIQTHGARRPKDIPGLPRIEELKINNKIRTDANTSNTAESTPVEPVRTVPKFIFSKSKHKKKEPFIAEHSEAVFQEVVSRRKESPDQILGVASSLLAANAAQQNPDTERFIEPMVAPSSGCSHVASNDSTYYLKRKYHGTEESAYNLSENHEDDDHEGFVKSMRARGNSGSKRSRTSQVHTLSERRRRYKINKKILALQELIPNCNKVDKASMLDEAIEYVKTLQIQTQIMSIGSMPQMMMPTGIQQLYASHIPHFFPVGAGMGMGMGMGVDYYQPQFHNYISGATSLPGIPGQGLPISLSHAHFIPMPGETSAQTIPLGDVSGSSSSSMNSTQNIKTSKSIAESSREQTIVSG